MGVTGLWKLIDSSGKPVPLETLENKVLAIDISIWLHQVIKGYQDAKGGTLPNAHLLGLFHRLCKLLFYRIKPIFVFDGGVPALKRQTIAKRAESKNKLLNEADRLQSLILSTLAKEKVVQQALGGTAVDVLAKSPVKPLKKRDEDDLFKLPELAEEVLPGTSKDEDTKPLKTTKELTMHSIDVDSSNFKTLPADVRHEILTDIKETRKQNSWGRLHELPAQSDHFSSFQMQRLLKRRKVQVCLEHAEKEMGGQSLSVRDLEKLLTEDGVLSAETNAKRINSDDNTKFLMISSIKKAMESAIQEQEKKEEGGDEKGAAELGPEFDEDLKKAIQVSLEEWQDQDQEILMTSKQKQNLTEAAKDMARAYMMEYAGMSNEDVKAILGEGERDVNETLAELFEKEELNRAIVESLKEEKVIVPEEKRKDSDSEDDEMEEVKENLIEEKKVLEIVVNTQERVEEDEDIFADIFQKKNEKDDEEFETVVQEIEDSSDEEVENQSKAASTESDKSKEEINKSPSRSFELEKSKTDVIDLDSESDDDEPIYSEIITESISAEVKQKASPTIINNDIQPKEDAILPVPSTSKSLPKFDPKSILQSLEQQKAAITSLILDDLEVQKKETCESESVIEITDSPDEDSSCSSLSSSAKKRTLTDYYQTTPRKTPKATPEKVPEEENVPYVKSPFFVNRKSSEKKNLNLPPPDDQRTTNKATKFLFSNAEEPSTSKSSNELINEASELLKSQKSSAELKGLAKELHQQNMDLEQERNKQARFGMSITERMSRECQDMLRLFGVPFIVAPMESEAQCAFLNLHEITQGTVTDDSDVWLFGGSTVYKNFFDQKKYVTEFKMSSIEQLFHVDRKKLIQLALLVGSDYTPGISGIGAVTGMEILAQFSNQPEVPGETNEIQSMMSGLRKFREWWAQGGGNRGVGGGKGVLRSKLKNINISEGFPSRAVIEAYLHPQVDEDKEEFTWGTPDAETIREFAKKNFGWTRLRTDELLGPVMKKLEEKTVQKSIRNYFDQSSPTKLTGSKMSKRVERAVRNLDPGYKAVDEEKMDEAGTSKNRDGKKSQLEKAPKKRKAIVGSPVVVKKTKTPRIPETKQVIPQREKMLLEEQERKKKAAEILKNKKK